MSKIVSAIEHYDFLIDEGCDPLQDSDILKAYMSRWDGLIFYDSLCLSSEKVVLDIGIGTGRIAQNVLNIGCKKLIGLDISTKTLERARKNLAGIYPNVELVLQNIGNYRRENFFDLAYSVLTFMHIEDKEKALVNIVESLKTGGNIVLSISEQSEWLDYGSRKVELFYKESEYYVGCLERLGCNNISVSNIYDKFVLPNGNKNLQYDQKVATLIKATKK